MAAPAGTERSRPAASSAAGARVRQRSTFTPPPPTSSALRAVKRARRRGVQVFEVPGTAFLQWRRALYVRPTCGLGRFRGIRVSPALWSA